MITRNRINPRKQTCIRSLSLLFLRVRAARSVSVSHAPCWKKVQFDFEASPFFLLTFVGVGQKPAVPEFIPGPKGSRYTEGTSNPSLGIFLHPESFRGHLLRHVALPWIYPHPIRLRWLRYTRNRHSRSKDYSMHHRSAPKPNVRKNNRTL